MRLYGNITDTIANSLITVNITESHDAAVAVATIVTPTGGTGLDLGDDVTIDLGYTDQHQQIFTGYVKKLERQSPDGLMTVTAHDILSRAVDYFIVSETTEPYVKQDIETGDLIKYVLGFAGLTDFDFDDTSFIFATGGSKAEINLVNSYDYCKQLADLIAWNMWAESDGVIYLKNRKPFYMDGTLSQPGEVADTIPAPDGKHYGDFHVMLGELNNKDILAISLSKNEKDLRNKIVVYGANKLRKEASEATSYDPVLDSDVQVLPDGYYKAVCLSSLIITDGDFAQDACDYNLDLLNRVGYDINITVVGRPYYHARRVLEVNFEPLGISGYWYIYSCSHEFSKAGYTCSMVLRK